MSDLVCYQLRDRGCEPLLVLLFFMRDTSFENLLGALKSLCLHTRMYRYG